MPLSWNEIRQRAVTFSRVWSGATRERSEAHTFWNEFFNIFGVSRRIVASFEEPVKNLKGDYEFIDLFWKGRLIVEHKSRGKDLSRASSQAYGYVQNLINDNRRDEVPRYLLVSDFARFALHDLEAETPADKTLEFSLDQLHRHIRNFAFIAGYETRRIDPEDPANFDACERLGNLHDRLEDVGYSGHDLQRFMVRVLFCLFADDTGIFEHDSFKLFLQDHTRADASDLGPQLSFLFHILDTPPDKRPRNLDDDLAAFPYVNGDLYHEKLDFPVFDSAMRTALLSCCNFHWEKISPAVFGSLFQSVMEPRQRRQIGAHYTSERDIMKLIRSLFLDDLQAEFDSLRHDKRKLESFHRRLGRLKLFDPACGCGNFLVLAYRELRRLEMDVLEARFGQKISEGDVRAETRLHVDQLYGIEIEEWPVRIAEVALWLMDHQMNQELFERFGGIRPTIPLQSTPNIRLANALRIDWNDVLAAEECSYILGNPPFVGKKEQNAQQKADMEHIWGDLKGAGLLDYVTCWYLKAADYTRNTSTPCAFVSTNSITQGEQVGTLWNELFRRGLKIHFAHRTFAWASEARGKAHVHVVIIGFGYFNPPDKRIYDYELSETEPTVIIAGNISPYLIDGSDNVIISRSNPVCKVPAMCYGSMMIDKDRKDGDEFGLILTPDYRAKILAETPALKPYVRRLYGGDEFLNNEERWCLWLINAPPSIIRSSPSVCARLERIRRFREKSSRQRTRELAATPALFGEIRQPNSTYLLVPKVSSERRRYIPIGFVSPEIIASGSALIIPQATLYHFGVLSSAIHNAWMRQVCGRLESRFQYSANLVYNNFLWPQNVSDRQKEKVESCAQAVLDARKQFPEATLADLYDPLTMPPLLAHAHADLDIAVDRCYRAQPFTGDRQRFEFLFALYEQITAPLTAQPKRSRRSR